MMDDSVIAAIAHWPNVPHVYGWLALDCRGQWRLENSPITKRQITDFIGRNYECDDRGAWFFQNGPQRVYVHLHCTPWILRIGNGQVLTTHTGRQVRQASRALLDENGNLLIAFEQGIGRVDDRDLPTLFDANEAALTRTMAGDTATQTLIWQTFDLPLSPVLSGDLAKLFGFIANPQPADLG